MYNERPHTHPPVQPELEVDLPAGDQHRIESAQPSVHPAICHAHSAHHMLLKTARISASRHNQLPEELLDVRGGRGVEEAQVECELARPLLDGEKQLSACRPVVQLHVVHHMRAEPHVVVVTVENGVAHETEVEEDAQFSRLERRFIDHAYLPRGRHEHGVGGMAVCVE